MIQSQLAIEVFCSYAHEDVDYCKQLETHVSALSRQGLISLWHDQQILPGSSWVHTIDAHLETASIIVLLISADFIASNYCYEREMRRALARHEANEARVIPIVVRPCEWQQLPLGSLQVLPGDGKPVSMWASRDEAWTQVVARLRRVIEDLSLLSASTPRSSLPIIWMIPYPHNPFFLGRDELLSLIYNQLQTSQTAALAQPQAISGMGGIGKTQVAIEYAYRYFRDYQIVLWALAESVDALSSSYMQIAAKLNLLEKDAQEQEIVIEAVKTWLQHHCNWLLILDNADELTLITNFLPPVIGGHLLITTRASATGRLAHRIEVETFTPEQGALLLLRRASLLPPDAWLLQASEHDLSSALTISNELGGLPLALDQVGAYLEETGYGLADYQGIYQQHREYLLRERGGLMNNDHPEPVASTWSLSFARVGQKSAIATDMLRLSAFLSADAIPLAVMIEGTDSVAKDAFELGQAVEILRAYSLVKYEPVTKTLSLHRLVQVVLRDALSVEERSRWMQRAIKQVYATFPDIDDTSQWVMCDRWLSHALACILWIDHLQMMFPEAASLLNKTARYLHKRARYTEAEPLYERALSIREQLLGSEHLDTTHSLNNLASLYRVQGKYEEAETLYKQAISIRERFLGPEHPETAQSLNNLAFLYQTRGKYEQAETLYKQAISIRERLLGSEHPTTVISLSNLASLYRAQGKYEQAELLYNRVLSMRERLLGPEHPKTAQSLNNLAFLYQAHGRYKEAELLYERAFSIQEQVLGPEHPRTITTLSNRAFLLEEQGKYEEAEPVYKRVLSIREQLLGMGHPTTALSLKNLANLYRAQGKYGEAELLYQRALSIQEQVLGPEHPRTAQSLNNLANLYRTQGKYGEAELLYQRALSIRERQLGPEHPDTATTLHELAFLYQNQGKGNQAEPLYDLALRIYQQVLGNEHPRTEKIRQRYVILLREMGKDEKAKRVEEKRL